MREQGFSLLSIIIGLGLISIAFVTLQKTKLNQLKALNFLEGGYQHKTMEESLMLRMAEVIQRETVETCIENLEEAFDQLFLFRAGDVSVSANFVDDRTSLRVESLDKIPDRVQRAVSRCKTPYNDNDEKFYFCLTFTQTGEGTTGGGSGKGKGKDKDKDKGKGKGNGGIALFADLAEENPILSNDGFVEFAVQFRHLKNNYNQNCTEYVENYKESAIFLFYTMYWTGGTEKSKTFHFKNGLKMQGPR